MPEGRVLPFEGRNLRSSSGSSFVRISKGSEGKRFEGKKGERGRREKDKKKTREKNGAKMKSEEEKKKSNQM